MADKYFGEFIDGAKNKYDQDQVYVDERFPDKVFNGVVGDQPGAEVQSVNGPDETVAAHKMLLAERRPKGKKKSDEGE